ncbi:MULTISPECIES: benzoylformate decarboxylase [unclassified Novosphingobium]|uniref:benzoylformate decarboxylase n=1 Tax=unclassified Novosphingobium TaxID=2644732 RepID=UPI000F5E773C|nr:MULTISPECIES: benzoylformate decarboxylase [unclassified Novosphingobium]MBF5092908.1 benzoylformate decarboxylase [Novosphingobium sp. NBM11]RQW44787.1 benzoylformate decarboxylase [Novosphingobium sp. LASN5T]
MHTVRDATLSLLRKLGMTTVFGNPGSTELPMFRDFPDDFRYILGLQESIVMGMADGFAQATGNAALINLHSAAGVGHSLGNLFTAFKNQTPLVVTAGQQARSILPFEPFLFAERPTEFPRPYVKWAIEPARAQDVPAAIARAYYVAMEPPCGPTFVSVPVDDWDQPCDPIAPRRVIARNPGDPQLLDEIAGALAQASAPAFVLGAGIARDGAWQEAIALAERHSAKVWAAPFAAREVFPERHPLFAGFLNPGREAIVRDLSGHDLILVVGGPLSLYHTEGFGPHLPDGAQLYHIVDSIAVASWAPDGTAVIADAGSALAHLLQGPPPVARARPAGRTIPPALAATGLTDAYLLQQIARLRPAGSVIVEEAPSSRGAMHDHLPILDAGGFFTCASGGLGHGLPASIGVALGRPDAKVIAILGDGSSMYAIQGLWSAAQLGLPISFVIVNNRRYEALINFGRHFGLQQTLGTALDDIDFCALARGQGVSATRIDTVEALDGALAASFAAQGPTLVEVLVD